MSTEQINRLSRQTGFSVHQIEQYLLRCAGISDAILAESIREAALFEIEIDLLGR